MPESGIKVYAAVTNFPPRNPAHEKSIELAIGDNADFITLGHQLTGRLNFPRRISTAFYNCAAGGSSTNSQMPLLIPLMKWDSVISRSTS